MAVALSIALALQLAAQCAPTVAPQTIVSIATTESRLHPLALRDNTTGRSYLPATEGEAAAVAANLIRAHHSVDIGLMQVNSANLAPLGLSIPEAFDACSSIAAGARVLSGAYRTALRAALSTYNTGDPRRGVANGYVAQVVAASATVPAVATGADARQADTGANITPVTPRCAAPAWDVWGRAECKEHAQ